MKEDRNILEPNDEGVPMRAPSSSLRAHTENPLAGRFSLVIFFLTVLLVGILAGLYWWYELDTNPTPAPVAVERPTAEENDEPESTTAEAQVETMQALSPSDSLSAIEADIENTQLQALDTELNAIEAELDASLDSF